MAQFALYRSVRGVRSTIRLVEEADGVPIALRAAVRTFATDGIAKDGTPTGLEYAVIFTGTVVLLRPRWTKFDDAARLRALLLDDPDARVTNTIAYRLYAAAARHAESPVAIDLRRVFAVAQATTGATLARGHQTGHQHDQAGDQREDEQELDRRDDLVHLGLHGKHAGEQHGITH